MLRHLKKKLRGKYNKLPLPLFCLQSYDIHLRTKQQSVKEGNSAFNVKLDDNNKTLCPGKKLKGFLFFYFFLIQLHFSAIRDLTGFL
jgi:hypothetical protein